MNKLPMEIDAIVFAYYRQTPEDNRLEQGALLLEALRRAHTGNRTLQPRCHRAASRCGMQVQPNNNAQRVKPGSL